MTLAKQIDAESGVLAVLENGAESHPSQKAPGMGTTVW